MVSASAGSAAAQTVGDRKWEIEVSGGGTFSMRPARGTALPIEPDAPFTTVVGEPSRRVRSWFFGDGAALLNEAVQGFMYDVPPIDPLDDVLGTGLVGAAGVRRRDEPERHARSQPAVRGRGRRQPQHLRAD